MYPEYVYLKRILKYRIRLINSEIIRGKEKRQEIINERRAVTVLHIILAKYISKLYEHNSVA